jgi:hypothetical protein
MPHSTTSGILDPNETLPQILALQHAQESVDCILHTPRTVILRVEATLLKPLRDVLVTGGTVLGNVGIEYQEASPGEALADNLGVVLYPVGFGGGSIVVL